MKKSRSFRLSVEQIEDRITPSGTPAEVYAAVEQVRYNTDILKFITDEDLIGNAFAQPVVNALLDKVHLTNQNARDEINDFLKNVMGAYDNNPLTAEWYAEHMVNFGGRLSEALVGIAYAEAFAAMLNAPLTPYTRVTPGTSTPSGDSGGSFAPPIGNTLADLAITKTDGTTTYTPGANVTYTIVASNNGPSNVNGATVVDDFSTNLANVAWTISYNGGASGTASGTGDINTNINLPSGANATITVTARALSSATGNLTNTATIAAPSGITDSNLTNNSATDINTANPVANLALTTTDGNATYTAGSNITYTVTATNIGPSNVVGANVRDTFTANIANVSWTATYGNGASGPASGSGNLTALINLAAGGNAVFTVHGTILANTAGNLQYTANITVPSGTTDGNLTNNSSTDTNILAGTLELTSDAGMTNVKPDTSTGFTSIGDGITIRDMVVGNGTTALANSTVTLYYSGWLSANGTLFDTSRPNDTQFGLSGTIEGFREGIAGMEPGGIRQIFIPADKAYGNGTGPSGTLPPNSDLVFEVKLISVP